MAETSTKANQKKREKAFVALDALKKKLATKYKIRFKNRSEVDLEVLRKVASPAEIKQYLRTLRNAFIEWDKVAQ